MESAIDKLWPKETLPFILFTWEGIKIQVVKLSNSITNLPVYIKECLKRNINVSSPYICQVYAAKKKRTPPLDFILILRFCLYPPICKCKEAVLLLKFNSIVVSEPALLNRTKSNNLLSCFFIVGLPLFGPKVAFEDAHQV